MVEDIQFKLTMIAQDLEDALKDKLTKEGGGFATGALKSGIRVEVKGMEIFIYMEDYWKYVEYGTPPHMPPVDELKDWVAVKFGLTGKAGSNVAWAIAMHIKKYGTKPFPFVRTTLKLDYPKILKHWLGG